MPFVERNHQSRHSRCVWLSRADPGGLALLSKVSISCHRPDPLGSPTEGADVQSRKL
jgi:hypothetical protein